MESRTPGCKLKVPVAGFEKTLVSNHLAPVPVDSPKPPRMVGVPLISQILALVAAAEAAVFADARIVVIGSDAARRTGLKLYCAAELPAA